MENETEEAIMVMLTKEGKEALRSCSFNVNTLERKSFRVRKLEQQMIDIVVELAKIYRKQCPKDFKDWNIMVVPSFLNLIGCGIDILWDEEKANKTR